MSIADGGETISDLAVLRNQKVLFGPVASTATAWRVLDSIDAPVLAGLRSARAHARQVAWAQRAETTGAPVGASMAAGRAVDGLVLDFDASLVICHSEKEGADKTFKRTFGYHPLFCFLDNTNEALAGLLRDGYGDRADPGRVPARHADPDPGRRCRRDESVAAPRPWAAR